MEKLIAEMRSDLFAILAELQDNRANMSEGLISVQTAKLGMLADYLSDKYVSEDMSEITPDEWEQIENELNYYDD